MIKDFKKTLKGVDPKFVLFDELKTLQVNLGNRCNLSCKHCHVEAGPNGEKIMSKRVMEKIIDFLQKHPGLCVDITGGCPELNPYFKFFVDSISELASVIFVRTNLTVFFEPGLDWLAKWYREKKVVLIASLPCYTDINVERQRGQGTFRKSILALKILNELGYGVDEKLELDLVYNPAGPFLPRPQRQLEEDYRQELGEKYRVTFNNLFTLTNSPIGRFRKYLKTTGELEEYLQLLVVHFNVDAAKNIMCRNLLSIDYRGIVYNCDFNQALDIPITEGAGKAITIEQLDIALEEEIEIVTGEHCYCCTAGAGSSCTGTLVKESSKEQRR